MEQYINMIVELCLIPLLCVLTKFIVDWLDAKRREINQRIDNDVAAKYTNMIYDTVRRCVIATNQTYVEALKKENRFTKEAQEEAFKRSINAIVDVLSQDALDYMVEMSGDITTYLTPLIESCVAEEK